MKPVFTKLLTIFFLGLVLLSPCAQAKDVWVPSFENVQKIATDLALKPYFDDRRPLPPRLADINYDQLRDIRYNPKESVWRREKLPFQLQFFHPGGLNRDQIDYYLVDGDDIIFRAHCSRPGQVSIGFGECRGRIGPAS